MRTYLLACIIISPILNISAQVNFTTGKLSGTTLTHPTSLQFGPDGKLYVAVQDGTIYRYTVTKNGASYAVTGTEVITLINQIPNHNDDGVLNTSVTGRQVTGILVTGSPSNPKIYVTSSDPRIGGSGTEGSSPDKDGDLQLDTNSGIVSLLSWDGTMWTKTDLVRGLPRSEENHSQNGLALDESTNQLYVASGGLTNAGSPSVNFAMITEYALSACLLKIDLNQINSLPVIGTGNNKYIYDLPTVDDPTRTNSGISDVNDPFGGNDGRNQAKIVSGGPVQVFAPGYRNIYDLVITKTPGREGRIYAVDNGANQGWGGYPDKEGTPEVTNNYVQGEPGSLGPGVNDAQVNNLDQLHLIYKSGMTPFYGGHPNPIRANPVGAGLFWKDGTGNHFVISPTADWPPVPAGMANPVESDYRNGGVNDGALTTFLASTNGIAEYTATGFFGSQLTGDLLAASFDGAIYRIKLNTEGTAVSSKTIIASGFGSNPLDITAQGDNQIFPGTIWVADYVANVIDFFEPVVPTTSGSWSTVTPANGIYPESRHENAFTEAGGKFYLIGGRGSKAVNIFDPATKTWSTAAAIPGGKELNHFQAVTVNNKIYVINAFTGAYPSETPVPDIYVYDIVTNTWTVLPNAIPAARQRGSAATVVYNNKIYLAGGIVNGHNSGTVGWTDVYDPANGSWTALADAPHLRDHVQGSVINGKLYLAGGRRTSASTGVVFSDVEPSVDVYDIATNTWSTLPFSVNLPVPRAGASSVPYNGKLVIIGGESTQSMAHNNVHSLDPASNTWTAMPNLVTGRHGTGALVFKNVIYTAAGSSTQGGSASSELNTTEEYPTTVSGCSGNTTSTTMDDDADGYSNKDEADNQTDPCSAASKPADNDNDKLSNLNDPDDDNDGITDINDPFHIDAQNGKNKTAPLTYPFLNGDPGTGLFGMGFTGLMLNGTDPDHLYDANANGFIMGGASGLATVPASTGSPLSNSQLQAFQFGVMISSSSPITTVESGLVSPYFNSANPSTLKDELHGIYIGSGDQDNYVLIAVTPNFGNPGIAVISETGGVVTQNLYPVTGILSGNIILYLEINAAMGTVQPMYKRTSDAAPVNAGPALSLSGKLLNTIQGPDAVAVGILASSRAGNSFSATWDYIKLYPSSSTGSGNEKRINAGGPTVTAGGYTWTGDTYYTDTDPTYPSKTYTTTGAISNTSMPVIYQTERYGKGFTYNIPVTNGSYEVKLHFAELYWTSAGQRSFNVNIENGQGTLNSFDVFAEAGKNAAIVKSFNANVSDGTMTIQFTAIKDMAKINAIELLPVATGTKPIAHAGPDKSIVLPTNSVTLDGSGTDADGTIAGYQWTQVSGPNTAAFSSTTVAAPTVSGLVAGTYVFSLVVKDNSNLASDPDQVTVTVTSSSSTAGTNRINSGGPALNINGVSWSADQYYTDVNSAEPSRTSYFNNTISNTSSPEIYRSERYGKAFTYNVPVSNGSYLVKLHFAEIYWNSAGARVFSVNIENGQGTLNNFDIYAAAGKNVALVKEFTVNVSDGAATITFTSNVDLAKVSAIEVIPASAPPPPPPPSGSSIRINGGGPALTLNGNSWIADKYYTDVNTAQPSYKGSTTASISGTDIPAIYQTERYGKGFNYDIPLANGSYTVRLHFAEYYWSSKGQRVMNVNIENGQGALSNFDILANVAKNTALVKEFTVNLSDGTLNIQFSAVTDNAKISGIEIVPATTPPPPTGNALFRINNGGPELNDGGVIWSADSYYSADPSYTYRSSATIANTSNQELYRTERYGKNFSYAIPVPTGSYEVRLHFAELYWASSGSRVFNVNVENGQGSLTNFDIFAAAGKNAPLVRSFVVNCSDGYINIALTAVTDNAKLSGIEILPSTNSARSGTAELTMTSEQTEKLDIKASPNPSVNDFSIRFVTGKSEPVQLRVINASGVLIETLRNLDPSRSIRLGLRYPRGTYFIEARQGSDRTITTVIKQ